jgi:hypothetical protein
MQESVRNENVVVGLCKNHIVFVDCHQWIYNIKQNHAGERCRLFVILGRLFFFSLGPLKILYFKRA